MAGVVFGCCRPCKLGKVCSDDKVYRNRDPELPIAIVGPLPPPLNGQTLMTSQIAAELKSHSVDICVINIGGRGARPRLGLLNGLWRSIKAMAAIGGHRTVYIAVKAGKGMWLTTAAAAAARRNGSRIFLHHHSYAYVGERKARMVALARVAGPDAHHIVLSPKMSEELKQVMPELNDPLILGPAWRLEKELLDLPLRADGAPIVLGHLSILTLEKGVAEAVDLAIALNRAGTHVRLIMGGPIPDAAAKGEIERARRDLGDLFEYRGALHGQPKIDFFGEITHFVFPSRYAHEAVPAVLNEAMAAGAVCVATKQGLIPDMLQNSPSLLAERADSFVAEVMPFLVGRSASADASAASREAFLAELDESKRQLAHLVALVTGED